MPTQLTTPITRTETHATIDQWLFTVSRVGLNADPANCNFVTTMRLRLNDGTEEETKQLVLSYANLPASAQLALRNFHNSVVAFMRTQGLLPAGTDTPDFT